MEHRHEGSSLRHHISTLTVVGWIVAACLTLRAMVQEGMFLGQTIPIIPGLFGLRYLRNPRAAFSLLSTAPEWLGAPFFSAVEVLALMALTFISIREEHESWRPRTGLAGVAGGAASNLVQRLLAGDVVDYPDPYVGSYQWPTFNLADTTISIGLGLLLLDQLWARRATSLAADGGGETHHERVRIHERLKEPGEP